MGIHISDARTMCWKIYYVLRQSGCIRYS